MPTKTSKKRATKKKNPQDTASDVSTNPKSFSSRLKQQKLKLPPEEVALEHTISRILLLRFQIDIARLFSTHIHNVAKVQLPKLIISCLNIAPPGWLALNADSDEIKDYLRGALVMDMRQAGERVATKSVLWSYTVLHRFALSHNIPICGSRGLHSHLLIPHHSYLRSHLETLESLPSPYFTKPPHLGTLEKGYQTLERHCLSRQRNTKSGCMPPEWNDWKPKIIEGYERLVETLWEIASELDVRGYGLVLRDKLTDKWCCLSCLGTVCEPTLRTDEAEKRNKPIKGKEREWDGRGAGIHGWDTEAEEDLWEAKLDFGGSAADGGTPNKTDHYHGDDELEDAMSVGELMEWRYIKAEREKELGNAAFKRLNYTAAVRHYENAYSIEPELPHYQLNLAAAHLKLSNWMEAEKACTVALGQQHSGKGYWRRAKARRMLGRDREAEEDLQAILKIHPGNADALAELAILRPPPRPNPPHRSSYEYGYEYEYDLKPPDLSHAAFSSPASSSSSHTHSSPSTRHANASGPTKLKHTPIPFEITERDRIKLRFCMLPLTIQIDPGFGSESFSYPSWDRYCIEKA